MLLCRCVDECPCESMCAYAHAYACVYVCMYVCVYADHATATESFSVTCCSSLGCCHNVLRGQGSQQDQYVVRAVTPPFVTDNPCNRPPPCPYTIVPCISTNQPARLSSTRLETQRSITHAYRWSKPAHTPEDITTQTRNMCLADLLVVPTYLQRSIG